MSLLMLVSLVLIVLLAGTGWSVKTRSRWTGNGALVFSVGLLLWVWLLVAATGAGFAGTMWIVFGLSHAVVACVGWLTARWMGDALPGVDGRGWFHLSTVVAAAELLSLGAGALAMVLRSIKGIGGGGDDVRFSLVIIGVAALVLWVCAVVSMIRYLRDVGRGRRRRAPERADAVIVLGAGLVNDRVSDLLASRCDRGAAAWHSVTEHRPARSTPLIVTGGRGDDEPCTEAEAMHRYLASRGFPRGAVLEERYATDTTENLHFSLDLLKERGVRDPHVVVCTSDFHVLRTERIIAALEAERGDNGVPFSAVVLGAPTPKPAIPASYLREYVALTIHRIIGRA
ncbi:YdcF family protein [Corynebacterium variabile]|uniref:YdcF family protein n=2 Tax=Corynebacterium variabile TaxID=1727 RepID=UPI001DAFF586|nr:YdcF family protein [Corynebacterium variabile]HJG44857.1 YdcF family protein [Corynebacterium variabile]